MSGYFNRNYDAHERWKRVNGNDLDFIGIYCVVSTHEMNPNQTHIDLLIIVTNFEISQYGTFVNIAQRNHIVHTVHRCSVHCFNDLLGLNPAFGLFVESHQRFAPIEFDDLASDRRREFVAVG